MAASHAHRRSHQVVNIGVLASCQLTSIAGGSSVADAAAWMFMDYAWSSQTNSAVKSQWKSWLNFYGDDQISPLPVTEGHVLKFNGWLKSEQIDVWRSITAASAPQYLSAVRKVHILYVGVPAPAFPMIELVLRALLK